MSDKLKIVIQQILEEQWSSLTSSHIFGKDRNIVGTNSAPGESDIWNETNPKEVEYKHKLRDLEPVIKQGQQYYKFLKEFGDVNPNDEASLYRMYENFLHYFSIDKMSFQDGDHDDKTAALAVAEYFQYHPDRVV